MVLARAIEWLAKASMHRRNGNDKVLNKSGERSTGEWESKMRDIARDANEDMMADMRNLLEAKDAARNETLREIIRQELNNRERR